MSEKMKKSTSGKLLVRSGGLALSLPIVFLLGGILLLVNVLMTVILIGALGGLEPALQPYIWILFATWMLGLAGMFGLFYGVARYTGGMRQLWLRLRGIQEERARVERLMEQQQRDVVEDVMLDTDTDDSQQQKYH